MSKTYQLLCLNHVPVLQVEGRIEDKYLCERIALGHEDRPQGHEHCDLAIGEFSGGLVGIGVVLGNGEGLVRWTSLGDINQLADIVKELT